MTIINPKYTSRSFISPLMCGALILIIIGAVGNILIYNQTVDLGHAIQAQEKTLEAARAENATLKNELYQKLDRSAVEARARTHGFVKIIAPHYLAAH